MPLNTLHCTGQLDGLFGRVLGWRGAGGGTCPHGAAFLLPEDFVRDFSARLPGRHPFSFHTFKHCAFISSIVPRYNPLLWIYCHGYSFTLLLFLLALFILKVRWVLFLRYFFSWAHLLEQS